jgi:ring-1,2-phenylacetyl-CoA epoxidase subunit PaaD
MVDTQKLSEEDIWQELAPITDPEIPVITIEDLGILRKVERQGEKVVVTITPTYSGCPAMSAIGLEIRIKLKELGFEEVEIKNQLSPAWNTDWLSEVGRQKLEEYGIAPPQATGHVLSLFGEEPDIRCPHCKSENTHLVSQFGSTSCKALYQCNDCLEPFDYFKCHR